jgi:uncharacterized protein (TIGR00299 family) protein
MMKALYYDCFAGISGDMNLGALIDLGVDVDYLKTELAKLNLQGYILNIRKDIKKGISGTKVEVNILNDHDPNHHHENHKKHVHIVEKNTHEHHIHRTFGDIKKIINNSLLSAEIKSLSIKIFEKVALAESKIHQVEIDNVHFHEVGAIDSIIDIVGAAICIDSLKPDIILSSPVELGSGFVKCAHGTYPVPAPATAEILRGIPVRKGNVAFEATTPTGAAILAACASQFTESVDFRLIKAGYGIGSRDGDIPNVLRVFLAEKEADTGVDVVKAAVVECNIDDMNPEFYDYIIELLFEAGAKDVYITQVIMKKSRPAATLSVLTDHGNEHRIIELLFMETSTLGVRKYFVEKSMLQRTTESIDTPFGKVKVKSAYYNGKKVKSKPEYDDCLKIAREKKLPLNQVYKEIEKLLK